MANRVSQWFRKLSGHHAHHHHRKMTREDFQKLPRHVAIIMDGNGRWAKQHRLNVAMGHRQGTETLREIIRHTDDLKIEALSIYAFSTENWKRSKEEVGALLTSILIGVVAYLVAGDARPLLPAWYVYLILGILGGVVGEMGDLFFSLVKRHCGMKDFSNLFPGHGGMLDRLDSVLFMAMLMLCYRLMAGI